MSPAANGEYVTRREIDQLIASAQRERDAQARQVTDLESRFTELDEHGSRGLTGVSVQLAQVIKDVGRLEKSLEDHEEKHDREAALRTARHQANIRWAIGLAVALLTSNGGIIWAVVTHTRLH